MNTELEVTLARTLAGAAEAAPEPGQEFVAGVRRHERRLRRHRVSAVAAGVVAIAIMATLGIVNLAVGGAGRGITPGPTTAPTAGPTVTPPPDRIPVPTNALPAQEVWPHAVRELPASLPDGRSYLLAAVVEPGRYVVMAGSTEDRPPQEVLDWTPATQAVRTVARAPTRPGVEHYGFLPFAVVADGHIAWIAAGGAETFGPTHGEIWVAPAGGGAASEILTIADGATVISDLRLIGTDVVYSVLTPQGPDLPAYSLRKVPRTGGTPQALPDSGGFLLLRPGGWASRQLTARQDRELWNVLSGDRQVVQLPPGGEGELLVCSQAWCVSTGPNRTHAQRVDGTEPVVLSIGGTFDFTANPAVVQGTFFADARSLLWDLRTGLIATFPPPQALPGTAAATSLPYWNGPNGELVILIPELI